MSNLVREPEIWVSMCRRFPWVVEERGEFGDGLVHLDFAALRRGVEKAADSGDVSTASDILAFVEDLLEKVDTLHPEVVNALDISFLEDLYLAEPHQLTLLFPCCNRRVRRAGRRSPKLMTAFLANAGLSNLRLQQAAPRAAAEPRR